MYEFVLDTSGTLWWHSHTFFQKSSLYGAIIIEGDEEVVGTYPEFNLLLNDFYHRNRIELIAGLLHVPFTWVGDPESSLINGRGNFSCSKSLDPCNETSLDKGPAIIDVKPDTTYRVRIIGASSLLLLNLNIERHFMTMVEVETALVKRFKLRYLDVAPGQPYSVLLRTKTKEQLAKVSKNNGMFWISVNSRLGTGPSGHAILRYSINSGDAKPLRNPSSFPDPHDAQWSLHQARQFRSLKRSKLPDSARILTVLGTINLLENGRGVWAVNNISYVPGASQLLQSLAFGIQSDMSKWVQQTTIPTVYDYNQTQPEAGLSIFTKTGTHVMKVNRDEVVDMVFQNARGLGGDSQFHPW